MTPELYGACRRAVHVLRPDGTLVAAGRATLVVLSGLGWRRAAWVLSKPPFIWGVEWGYGLVARHRRIFGRFLFRA